jgi:hypothetical protein
VSLLDFHVELSLTNTLLARIAVALERLAPVPSIPDHSKHPLIGAADVSRLTPEKIRELEQRREEQFEAAFSTGADGGAGTQLGTDAREAKDASAARLGSAAVTSVSGVWDYEDDLDDFGHSNYPPGSGAAG